MSLLPKKENGTLRFPTMRTRLDELFDFENFFSEPFLDSPVLAKWGNTVPATNVKETDQAFTVELAVPGLQKEDFSVDVTEGVLEVKAEQKAESTSEAENYTRREYSFSNFRRAFTLPENVDAENIKANYNNGVLCVELPKVAQESTKPRKEIQVT